MPPNLACLSLLLVALILPAAAMAQESDDDPGSYYARIGGYVHFTSDEKYAGPPILVSIERSRPRRYYYGLALFNNSFGQFSQFLFVGREYPWKRVHENFRFRVSYGIIHGYKGDFEDDLPGNFKGYAPGIVPSIGFKSQQTGYDLALLGKAGLLFTIGHRF